MTPMVFVRRPTRPLANLAQKHTYQDYAAMVHQRRICGVRLVTWKFHQLVGLLTLT
jgi:hypothetical protein